MINQPNNNIHLYNNLGSFLLFFGCLPYVLLSSNIRTPGIGGPHLTVECIILI